MEKQLSAIQNVTLNTATFENETFEPAYINFFFGKNGAGKTSLARQLSEGSGLQWAVGQSPANYMVHVYSQDFIDTHFRTLDKLQGVFSLSEGEQTEETERKLKELADRQKALEKRKAEIGDDDTGELAKVKNTQDAAEKAFQAACLRNTSTLRDKFKQAFKGSSRNPQLAQRISSTTIPKDCDEAELEARFRASFAEGARKYPYLTELDGDDHIAAIPTCPLLGERLLVQVIRNMRASSVTLVRSAGLKRATRSTMKPHSVDARTASKHFPKTLKISSPLVLTTSTREKYRSSAISWSTIPATWL